MATFGHNPATGGATPELLSDDYTQIFGPYSLPTAATINSISVWLLQSSNGGVFDMRACAYADSAGSPGALVATTTARHLASFGAAQYIDFTFSADPTLAAGSYWLGFQVGNHTNLI